MKGRLAMLLAALCALAAVTQPSGAAASQKWSQIGLSRDGHHWSAKMRMPLFAGHIVLVPSTRRTARFYVRNQSGETARLKVLVRVHDRSGWLRDRHLRMWIHVAHQRWIRMNGRRSQPVRQMLVRPGQAVPVVVVVRLTRRAGNRSMGRHLTFTVLVRLTQRSGQGTL